MNIDKVSDYKNSAQIYLGYDYIKKNKKINWDDIFFGFKHRYLLEKDIENYAIQILEENEDDPIALNILVNGIEKSCNESSINDNLNTSKKYLYFTIKYICENKDKFDDPFNEIDEAVYEFGNPPEIKKFTEYISASDERFNWPKDKIIKYRKDGLNKYLADSKRKYE